MIRYIKCPRCELNYIDGDKQEYCDVCIAEMKGDKLEFVDIDDDEMIAEMEDEATETCTVCGVNLIRSGEKMCDECKKKSVYDEEPDVDVDIEQDEVWKDYLNDDTDLSLEDVQLDEALKGELDEEDEEYDEEYEEVVDDFETVDYDGDFDEDEDDEDDEDDDDDLF